MIDTQQLPTDTAPAVCGRRRHARCAAGSSSAAWPRPMRCCCCRLPSCWRRRARRWRRRNVGCRACTPRALWPRRWGRRSIVRRASSAAMPRSTVPRRASCCAATHGPTLGSRAIRWPSTMRCSASRRPRRRWRAPRQRCIRLHVVRGGRARASAPHHTADRAPPIGCCCAWLSSGPRSASAARPTACSSTCRRRGSCSRSAATIRWRSARRAMPRRKACRC